MCSWWAEAGATSRGQVRPSTVLLLSTDGLGLKHRKIHSWLMDMDGVLVREEHAIPGADRLPHAPARARDPRLLVLTNNSIYTRPRPCRAAPRVSGLEVPEDAIWTSALATAKFLVRTSGRAARPS